MIIPTWAKVLIVLALIGGIYFAGYSEGKSDCLSDRTESELTTLKESIAYERTLQDRLRETSLDLQNALTNVRTVTEWRTNTVTREVKGDPIYQSCTMPATGVEIINQNVEKLNGLRSKP